MSLSRFQDELGYHFKDESLLELALTHPSFTEHKSSVEDNQRLEFLGDAILDFVIADILYREHENLKEGDLSRMRSRLVCEDALHQLARNLHFEEVIRLGKGELSLHTELRPAIMADAYEAVIGAIYLDGGMQNAESFIAHHHADFLADPYGSWTAADAKSALQEKAQAQHIAIRYEVIGRTGPEHTPSFEVAVYADDRQIGIGTGHNKKSAQQAAAADALNHLEV